MEPASPTRPAAIETAPLVGRSTIRDTRLWPHTERGLASVCPRISTGGPDYGLIETAVLGTPGVPQAHTASIQRFTVFRGGRPEIKSSINSPNGLNVRASPALSLRWDCFIHALPDTVTPAAEERNDILRRDPRSRSSTGWSAGGMPSWVKASIRSCRVAIAAPSRRRKSADFRHNVLCLSPHSF